MKTLFFEAVGDRRSQKGSPWVKCGMCSHFCRIPDGGRGICLVRENQNGDLVLLNYPNVVASAVDPIEKKPIYHLLPGSRSYSIACVGCNFSCSFCQNAQIARQMPEMGIMASKHKTDPASIVSSAMAAGCRSISYTYSEPAVFFELALETAYLASEKGLLNIFVTNGYMSEKAINSIAPFLDAANVDLKSFDDGFYKNCCKARLAPVKERLVQMVQMGILVEVTTLLIPGLNDSASELRQMAEFIAEDLGESVPWHISRFHPCHEMTDRPITPDSSLLKARQAGLDAGLCYVYLGNAPHLGAEDTFCPGCRNQLVTRSGYQVDSRIDNNGCCPECGQKITGCYA